MGAGAGVQGAPTPFSRRTWFDGCSIPNGNRSRIDNVETSPERTHEGRSSSGPCGAQEQPRRAPRASHPRDVQSWWVRRITAADERCLGERRACVHRVSRPLQIEVQKRPDGNSHGEVPIRSRASPVGQEGGSAPDVWKSSLVLNKDWQAVRASDRPASVSQRRSAMHHPGPYGWPSLAEPRPPRSCRSPPVTRLVPALRRRRRPARTG